MEKTVKSKIPEKFWKTPETATLRSALHTDGWDAIDCLHSVSDCLKDVIDNTNSRSIKAELKKARQKVEDALNSYREATDILSDKIF